ncbi:hypothetical protein [Streptomyces sp. NPDC088915]|uniref:hypothetical protein n=1 Tax=Streptomyces sp. NPDC088915 TaxID=3365912 RepID=UPI0038037BFB
MPQIGTDPATARVWSTTDSTHELWHAFGPDGHALCNRRIRPGGHREGRSHFFTRDRAETFPLSHTHDRCRDKLTEAAAANKARSERDRAQYILAADLFAALHPAARKVVESYRGNVIDTLNEGGPYFTPADVWGHIGAEPAVWLTEDGWATAEGFNEAYSFIDRRAAEGTLTRHHWDLTLSKAREVLAQHAAPVPLTTDKAPVSRQVLYFLDSPLTGEHRYDLPVHSVVRTDWLRLGRPWEVIDARLAEQGLARYGFPRAESNGHALAMARTRWEEEGPYAEWWDVIKPELDLQAEDAAALVAA